MEEIDCTTTRQELDEKLKFDYTNLHYHEEVCPRGMGPKRRNLVLIEALHARSPRLGHVSAYCIAPKNDDHHLHRPQAFSHCLGVVVEMLPRILPMQKMGKKDLPN